MLIPQAVPVNAESPVPNNELWVISTNGSTHIDIPHVTSFSVRRGYHSLAITSDTNVWDYGDNEYGQGGNTYIDHTTGDLHYY